MTTLTLTPAPTLQPDRRYSPGVSTVPQGFEARSLDDRFALGAAGLREAYDAHGGLVYALARRALDGDAAQDVTQEVFVSAWRARGQFDPQRGSLAAWLVGITKRRIVDHHRAESRHAARRADGVEVGGIATRDADVEGVADRLLVADGLRHLPDDVRRVIQLAYIDDLTHQEIAERTSIPLGTVKSHIRRGLMRIREHVQAGRDDPAGDSEPTHDRRHGSVER